MRIVGAVVVALVLFGSGHVRAEEPKRERSERCLEICDFDFEKCSKAEGPKGPGRCNIDVVRCKNACPFVTIEEPAVPTAKSHQRCVDRCRDTYAKCLADPKNKSGGNCAADDMRCERACPAPPEVAEVAPVAPGVDGQPAAGAPAAAAPPRKKKARRAARVEGSAAPAPLPAPAAPPPVVERTGTPPPTVRSEAAAAPATAPVAPAAAAGPAQQERGFFGKLGCFFVSCEPAGSTPCLQQCAADYDECLPLESKRGGECATRLMNCRKACSAAAPAQ